MEKIYLASESPWRLQLLENTGLTVSSVSPNVDEKAIVHEDPIQTAHLRASAKADSGFRKVGKKSLVIGADQVVYLGNKVYGKPQNSKDWLERLQSFRGRSHLLTTAVSLRSERFTHDFHETTRITFRKDLDDQELQAYIRHGEAKGCAGGYMVEMIGGWMIDSIHGDWQNVIGLPIFPLLSVLRQYGWAIDNLHQGN